MRGPTRKATLHEAIDGFPLLHVIDTNELKSCVRKRTTKTSQARWLAIGLVIAFTAIALVNTIAMMISMRASELTALRLNGATKVQVRHELYLEVGFATLAAIAVGTAIAVATVGSFSHGLTGRTAPVIPPLVYGAVVSTAVRPRARYDDGVRSHSDATNRCRTVTRELATLHVSRSGLGRGELDPE